MPPERLGPKQSTSPSAGGDAARSGGASCGAAAVAVVPYMLAESVLGAGLDAMLGERPAAAMRRHLPAGAIAIPFALLGAGAGIAAVDPEGGAAPVGDVVMRAP